MRRALIFCAGLGLAACQAPAAHGPNAFMVEIALTPAATARLMALHEKVAVAAYYYGLPAPGVQAGQDGEVDLGSEKLELAPAQTRAAFTGAAIGGTELKSIAGRPHVLINVFSARLAAPDNRLDCSIFDGEIAAAQAKPPRITCDLLTP